MSTIKRIQSPLPRNLERKRVAAYARVSSNHEKQENSLAAQIDYYRNLIHSNPSWEYCGLYVDDGISGTQISGRTQFQQLIQKCEEGSIDIILTKSISRFARNTLDLLSTIRHLKELSVDVRFEKEHINTLSETGELMLTLLGTFAQEESRSTSENLRWAVKKKYEQGISMHHRLYGYQWTGKELEINKEEAKVVRSIFKEYLKGKSMRLIADGLNKRSLLHYEKPFNTLAIYTILHNERYIGDTLLQKTYCANFMTHKRKINRGEYPKYYVKGTQKAIISHEIFDAVAKEIARRKELGVYNIPNMIKRCFTGKITCAKCGSNYVRAYKTPSNANWRCASNRKYGANGCRSIGINEEQLKKLCAYVMGIDDFNEVTFTREIDHISGLGEGTFTFFFVNGKKITQFWDTRAQAHKGKMQKERQQEYYGETSCQQ